ncbi:MAG TPA: terminase, partial [Balneola sp.]|nr:terminase [Balneola sp.]
KKLGCSVLKSLVENDKLLIQDMEVINELYTFIAKGQSFEADEGHTDDLVMCLVMFGWLTRQDYFKNLTERDVRLDVYEDEIKRLEEEVLPFGLISSLEDDEDTPGWQEVR